MDTQNALQILTECKPLTLKLLEPGAIYTYEPAGAELESLRRFATLYDEISGAQLKLLAGEALITPIELLYLLDLLALTKLRDQLA